MFVLTYEIGGRGGDETTSIATFNKRKKVEDALEFIAGKLDVDFNDFDGSRLDAGDGTFVIVDTKGDPHNPDEYQLVMALAGARIT
jgi:hypothetical protein